MTAFKTHIPMHPNDPTRMILVGNRSDLITANFKQSEVYNKRTGLKEHPIALELIEAAQFLRDYYGIPIRFNSTYRNYVPKNGVKRSLHMLAMAGDIKFLADEKTTQNLLIQLRHDFDQQGPVFQELWKRGVRGFGSYDSFIHLDVGKANYYEFIAAKRKRKFAGERYGRWNEMVTLKRKKPSFIVQPAGQAPIPIEVIEAMPPPPVNAPPEVVYETPPESAIEETIDTVKQVLIENIYGTEDGSEADASPKKTFTIYFILLGLIAAMLAFLALR